MDRLLYLARETWQNLVRNPLPTIAIVTTVAVSLTMLAVTLLTTQGVANAFERWNNDVSFIVYMNPDAEADLIDSVGDDLESSPQIKSIDYLDHAASYDAFKKLFPDDPTITDTVKAEDLPTSFRVQPENPEAKVVEQLAITYESKPGVYQVDFVADAVRAVQRISGKVRFFLLAGSGVLLAASLLLIFNSIQTAVYARRREIEVQKLVGATNWYIRLPFVMEGLLQGLVGSVLAAAFAFAFQKVWLGSFTGQTTTTLFDSIRWTNGEFRVTMIMVFVIGSLVGSVGALISTTWYLRV
jgi:cell division transport system permease protein